MFIKGYEFDEMSQRSLYGDVTQKLVDICCVPPGGVVVDVGCGSGLATALLLDRYVDVRTIIGIDPSVHELEIAKMRVRDPKVRFLLGRAQDVESVVGQVDATILSNVIHQIPAAEREPMLASCHRMLKHGGRCALNTLFYDSAVVPETRIFYARWMYETNAWLKSHRTQLVLRRPKPTALDMFSAQQHEGILKRVGFSDVCIEEATYSWSIDDWNALCGYSVFIEGATGLSDVPLGARALKSALRKTFADLKLDTVPRRWLFASGVKAGMDDGTK